MIAILILLVGLHFGNTYNIHHLTNVAKTLGLQNHISIQSSIRVKVDFMKKNWQNNQYQEINHFEQVCGLNLNSTYEVIIKDHKLATVLLLNDLTFENILTNLECGINQEVYLINVNTSEVFETYMVKDLKIERKLGDVDKDGDLIWIEDSNMLKRRSNFQGTHLKAMTDVYGDWIKFNNTFTTKAPFYTNSNTYEVTNYVSGILIDIMDIIKSELNFTIDYYLRKDRQWGNVAIHPNGTYGGSGMVPDVFFERVDILVGTLSLTTYRFPFVDYLPPSEYYPGNQIFFHVSFECLLL